MKYFSMFSGIGGFEIGIEKAWKHLQEQRTSGGNIRQGRYKPEPDSCETRWEGSNATCVGYSEIDKYAIQTYKKHFPTHKNWGDATKINPRELPNFDMRAPP